MDADTHPLRDTLRRARATARLSQLALALRLGVSQRHISFVESGRAQPGRALLHAWLHELNVPLTSRNMALQAAGFAPSYSAGQLGDAELAMATNAMQHLMQAHDPMPAWIIDADWNVLHANRGGRWLVATLAPTVSALATMDQLNMIDLMLAPDGLIAQIVNVAEIAPTLIAQLRAEAITRPTLTSKVDALAAALRNRVGTDKPWRLGLERTPPVLTTRFATTFGVLSFFTMLTTFGSPQDITLASLRVEHMFAADAETAAVLATEVSRFAP